MNVICEDRTGGGLPKVIFRCVKNRRSVMGRDPLHFPASGGTVDGNEKLLRREIRKYPKLRQSSDPNWDHVVYVLDAKNVWKIGNAGIAAPRSNEATEIDHLVLATKEAMRREAEAACGPSEWSFLRDGFHPHVLVWERESLILPVAHLLNLGVPNDSPYAERSADSWVAERFRQMRSGSKYDKNTDGGILLGRIAESKELRDLVISSNPSLEAIVNELSDL